MKKKIKVTIHVAVDSNGKWNAAGWPDPLNRGIAGLETAIDGLDSCDPYVIHTVEVEVPVPAGKNLRGKVVETSEVKG